MASTAFGAEGSRVELLGDCVEIRRDGFFSGLRQGKLTRVPLDDISQVLVTSPKWGLRGVFVIVVAGETANGGFGSNNDNPRAVYFDAAKQPEFERLRSAIMARVQSPTQYASGSEWAAADPRVLVLTSRPRQAGISDLDVDLEERVIVEQMQTAGTATAVEVRLRPASTADTLLDDLLLARPTIVHFSGHGLVEGIVVETIGRGAALVGDASLARLFEIPEISANLRVVVLNACLSADQARRLAERVPCVIGTLDNVLDRAAIGFASGFYSALGHGISVASSFAAGVAQVSLTAGEAEAEKYALFRRMDTDPSSWGIVR